MRLIAVDESDWEGDFIYNHFPVLVERGEGF